MERMIELRLKAIKEFQDKYPTSHVGGSYGLMIRGIDLKRDLKKSDLDFTIDEYEFKIDNADSLQERSDPCDFDYGVTKPIDGSYYVKIDIRVTPEPSFDIIEFNGVHYNVSKLRDILFWKRKYANKGVQKHIDDLETIKTGIRPLKKVEADYDLPF